MSHSARSSLSDLSVQTLPLTPAVPSHKRTPSRTYFSLADEEFPGPVSNAQPEVEVTHGFEKLGFGESVAIGQVVKRTSLGLVSLASEDFNFANTRETLPGPILLMTGRTHLRHLGKTSAPGLKHLARS
ncbi:hypothetical protein RSOLAG1IB_06259 [Rhizoctonia solani AG-1 IB]|uniref:Uncharacterized protein n=1 Tax=Thanatephorus cucumeris (strain AG1-IB / isolate 7/3/14) TaxID=1108050 RepID=A0A0B7FAM0_THACB|nr:hypothetical protein RSOLAG1IB_06259 [Rhizoctonia solani AG-1 IB]